MNKTVWFNQSLLNYKNYDYSPGSKLQLVISNSTSNFNDFSDPKFGVCIFKDDNKNYNTYLKLYEVMSIVNAFNDVKKDMNSAFTNNYEIERKINNRTLRIKFKVSKKNERIIIIAIIFSSSDFAVTVITPDIFDTLYQLMISFINEYYQISTNLITRSLLTNIRETLNNNTIKTSFAKTSAEDSIDSTYKNDNQNDFDTFIEKNIDNIEIPELCDIPNPVVKHNNNNIIITKVFNNIGDLEKYIDTLYIQTNPLDEFIKYMESKLDNILLPSIRDDEFKVLTYLSGTLLKENISSYYTNKQVSITGIPILKYICNDISVMNINVACELLVITIYLKIICSKIRNKNSDNMINKSLMYINFRNISDCLIFSFINSDNTDTFINTCISKYQDIKESGYFNDFDSLLNTYNCKLPSQDDIKSLLTKIVQTSSNSIDIINLYKKIEKNFELSLSDISKLTKEQINEFLNVNKKLSILQYIEDNNIDSNNEIYSYIQNNYHNIDTGKIIGKIDSNIIENISLWDYNNLNIRYNYEEFKIIMKKSNKKQLDNNWITQISANF